MTNAETGRRGEDVAARYYESKGYTVLARNFHTRAGELDLVCEDAKTLVFVEVKTRSGGAFGLPREAVDVRKQRKIVQAAWAFLAQHETQKAPRFDVLEVYFAPHETPKVRCLQAAFDAGSFDEF